MLGFYWKFQVLARVFNKSDVIFIAAPTREKWENISSFISGTVKISQLIKPLAMRKFLW